MKRTYKSHFRKFTLVAVLVSLIIFLWQINIFINQYKVKAENNVETSELQNSNNNDQYSVANNGQGYSDYHDYNDNFASNNEDNNPEPSNNENTTNNQNGSESIPEEENDSEIQETPEYVVSINLEQCINDFIEFNLLSKSGFNGLDEQTTKSTYKGLCDELIYFKPTNSYEFIYERPIEMPEMPYYVQVTGIFLLDNYNVRYE